MEVMLEAFSAGIIFTIDEVLNFSSETVQSTSSSPGFSNLIKVVSESI
jgi:hypothetical protein